MLPNVAMIGSQLHQRQISSSTDAARALSCRREDSSASPLWPYMHSRESVQHLDIACAGLRTLGLLLRCPGRVGHVPKRLHPPRQRLPSSSVLYRCLQTNVACTRFSCTQLGHVYERKSQMTVTPPKAYPKPDIAQVRSKQCQPIHLSSISAVHQSSPGRRTVHVMTSARVAGMVASAKVRM